MALQPTMNIGLLLEQKLHSFLSLCTSCRCYPESKNMPDIYLVCGRVESRVCLHTVADVDGEGEAVPDRNMKTCVRSRNVATLVLNLGRRWKWVVNSRPGRFKPGKELRYPSSLVTEPAGTFWTKKSNLCFIWYSAALVVHELNINMEHLCSQNGWEIRTAWRETRPSAALFTLNPTLTVWDMARTNSEKINLSRQRWSNSDSSAFKPINRWLHRQSSWRREDWQLSRYNVTCVSKECNVAIYTVVPSKGRPDHCSQCRQKLKTRMKASGPFKVSAVSFRKEGPYSPQNCVVYTWY
jgi:hypothetical protein